MLGERVDFEFRCFNNVNRFGSPGNTLSPCSADVPTSNYGKHPYHIERASLPVHAVFASPTLRRGGHFTFPQRGLPRLDHRICANVRSPSSVCASRAGLAVSHLFCLGGEARNLVCLPRRTRSPVRFRFGCSISMLGVLPHIFSRFPAPRIGFGRCALLLPLFRIGCEYALEPPRAPFSPNTYPAWGAEHPRTGARRAP